MRYAPKRRIPARQVSSMLRCYSGLVDGVIVVDKPEGLTSHDVVNRMRRLANTRKVGHLGTLDPMATGVLPLVLGRATRLAQFFSAGEKTYDARIQFGWSTDTYDREGRATSEPVDAALHARGAGSRAGRAFAERFCKRRRRFQRRRSPARRPIGWRASTLPWNWSRWRCTCSRWIWSNSMAPPRASACAARRELICAASRTMLGRELGCGAFLTSSAPHRVG